MQQIHKYFIGTHGTGGLSSAWYAVNGAVLVSDAYLLEFLSQQISCMRNHHKIMCGFTYSISSDLQQNSLNEWRHNTRGILKEISECSRDFQSACAMAQYKSNAALIYP